VTTDSFDEWFDRWYKRLDRPLFALPLPVDGDAERTMTWVHAGSSDRDKNIRHLAESAPAADSELIQWLSDATGSPAYWRKPGIDAAGVRLPIELGTQSWGARPGGPIPEDLDERVLDLKLAVVGDTVITVLGLEDELGWEDEDDDLAYALPATFIPNEDWTFDAWATRGAVPFAHELLRAVLTDIAWHHTNVRRLARSKETAAEERKRFAPHRLEDAIEKEASLAELQMQRLLTLPADDWFGGDEPTQVELTDRSLGLALERLRRARDRERDEVQLGLLAASHELTLAEQRQRSSRDRQAQATESLTRRITLVSVVFLPATLVAGLLGMNWNDPPFGGGGQAMSLLIALAVAPSAIAGLGAAAWLMRGRRRAAGQEH
jgi:hypothetical protein